MSTAFIFPGQGAQVVGMGKDFYEKYEESREIFDKASELLGFDMKELCFENEKDINITEYTQPALLTVSVAILRVLEQKRNQTGCMCRFKSWRILCHGSIRGNEL